MSISVFCPIKNEAQFIGYSIMSVLPYVDEFVYGDGNSTDGTIEIVEHIKNKYDKNDKIRLLKGVDCKNFTGDYVNMFNGLIKACMSNYIWFLHPDMVVCNPELIPFIGRDGGLAYWVNIRSFAGENLQTEIIKGRTDKWKTIMRNSLGIHYYGFYGAPNEDLYFNEITGNAYNYIRDMDNYPYHVADSRLNIQHYCECKPLERRQEKMANILHWGYGFKNKEDVASMVVIHPRVTLKAERDFLGVFEFKPREDLLPPVFANYREEFNEVLQKSGHLTFKL